MFSLCDLLYEAVGDLFTQLFLSVQEIETRASYMPGKHSQLSDSLPTRIH